jgi:hypothetical protein
MNNIGVCLGCVPAFLDEIIMPNRFSGSMTTVAIAAGSAVISVPIPLTQAQAPAAAEQALKTPWGEPPAGHLDR